jgi:UDP-N-acetylmuramate: L-alanyl-gamma-D-glutamyl-meso-diaminopimelate ligase
MTPSSAEDSRARLERVPSRVRHVHLIGVGGSAMAALAGMLAQRGLRVTGSDNQVYQPSASVLQRSGVELRTEYNPSNLEPVPDLVIVGNVVTRSNPEAIAVLTRDIPYLSMPEAMWHFFLKDRRVLMAAGTHGKTTSAAMMARVLEVAGRDPSMLIGGVARDFDSNYRCGNGAEFVIEGDEYDTAFFDKGPKFLHYRPSAVIITTVEFDHADIYRDLEHVKTSFRALSDRLGREHIVAVSGDSPDALEVTNDTRAQRLTFGLEKGEYRAVNVRTDWCGTTFSILRHESLIASDIRLPVAGRMNVANALGVWVLLAHYGIDQAKIAAGLAAFNGVLRRQQVVGEVNKIIVIDDFAHHPTAIRATLEAVAERYSARRILAAFEPRSNTSRRAVFQDAFAAAFDRASRIYLAPVYFKHNDPIPPHARLDVPKLANAISRRGPTAFACSSIDEIVQRMVADCRAGDVLLCMSNGPFEELPKRLLAKLGQRV